MLENHIAESAVLTTLVVWLTQLPNFPNFSGSQCEVDQVVLVGRLGGVRVVTRQV